MHIGVPWELGISYDLHPINDRKGRTRYNKLQACEWWFPALTGVETRSTGNKGWYCQVKETKLAGWIVGSLSCLIVPFESRETDPAEACE